MKKFNHILCALLAVGCSSFAFAAESSAPVISTTIEQKQSTSVLDKIDAGIFSFYHGASLKDLGSDYTLDRLGAVNKKFTTNFDATLSMHYLITKDIGFGPYVPFLLVPAPGQHFVIGDVGVEAISKKTIDRDGFRLATNLILQDATSDYAKARKMSLAIKTTPYLWYNLPHSNFKICSWTEVKYYADVNSGKELKLWAGPYVNYRLSDNFSINLEYEMEADRMYGAPTFDLTNYQTDLQPGLVWMVTPKVLVNPYVQISTGNKVTVENSALGAVISAKLL